MAAVWTRSGCGKGRVAGRGDQSLYDAFLSYSHATDGRLAPALQEGLHTLAKPWYRRRALRIFRDKTTLSATPALWPSIEGALRDSRFFILLVSPEAGASPWVEKEVQWWRQNRSSDLTLLGLTAGKLAWDPASRDFTRGSCVPASLRNWFSSEPLWVDLGWAREEVHVSLRNARFRDCVAEVAAPLHGVPKDELVGEDIRQHRRTRRVAWGAGIALTALSVASTTTGILALVSRNAAIRQRNTAQSRELASEAKALLKSGSQRAFPVAVEAARRARTSEAEEALRATLRTPGRGGAYTGQGAVTALAYDPRNDIVATGGSDGTLRFWDEAGNPRGSPVRSGQGAVRSIAFSPRGDRLATAGDDGSFRLWDAHRNPVGGAVRLPKDRIVSLSFSPRGDHLVVFGDRGSISVRDYDGEPIGRVVASGQGSIMSVAFSPRGDRLITGGFDGTLRIRGPSGRSVGPPLVAAGRRRIGVRTTVDSLAFSPRGDIFAAGDGGGGLRLWDASRRPVGRVRATGLEDVVQLAFDPNGRRVALGGANGIVELRDSRGHLVGQPINSHQGVLSGLAFDRRGDSFVTGGADGTFRTWSVDGFRTGPLPTGQQLVDTSAVSARGNRIVTQGTGGAGRLRDAEGRPVGPPIPLGGSGLGSGAAALAFTEQGDRLVAAGNDGKLRYWDTSGRLLRAPVRTGQTLTSLVLSPDNTRIVTGGDDGILRFWDLDGRSAAPRVRTGQEPIYCLAFSPRGDQLVTATSDRLQLRDSQDGAIRANIAGNQRGVAAAAFAPGGDLLVTGGGDGTFRLWDGDGRPIGGPIQTGQDTIDSVAFTPRGNRFVTAGSGTLRLWSVDGRPVGSPIRVASPFDHLGLAFDLRRNRLVITNSGHSFATREVPAAESAGSLQFLTPLYWEDLQGLQAIAERWAH